MGLSCRIGCNFIGSTSRSCGFIRQAEPDAFADAAFRRGFRIAGVGLLLDDFDDLFDAHVGLRVAGTDAGDAEFAHGAVEVRGKDLEPFRGGLGLAALVGLRQRADGEQVPFGSDGVIHVAPASCRLSP